MRDRPPIISLKSVTKSFPEPGTGKRRKVVDSFDFVVSAAEVGEFVVLIGPSGCGKTTLLNMVSGLLHPDTGEVRIFGELVTGPNARSATVWQAYTCFPWCTVLKNVEFGLAIKGIRRVARRRIARQYLTKVGLGDWFEAYPHQLSGGMQQRVAIARALAVRPSILLMDEPFGALDPITRASMQQILLELWQQERNSVIFITHDTKEALLLADRIVILSSSPGRIVTDFRVSFSRPRAPDLVHDPTFVAMEEAVQRLLRENPPESSRREIRDYAGYAIREGLVVNDSKLRAEITAG